MPPLFKRITDELRRAREIVSALMEPPVRTRIVRDSTAVGGGAVAVLLTAAQVRGAIGASQGMVKAFAVLILIVALLVLWYRWSHPPLLAEAGLPGSARRVLGWAGALVLVLGAGGWAVYQEKTAGRDSAIAVLPFVRVDSGGDLDVISDEIPRQIAEALKQDSRAPVVPFATVKEQGISPDSPFELGGKLRARQVLYGIVARAGSEVEIRASLLDVETQKSLRSWSYRRPASDVRNVQREIAAGIAQSLRGRAPSRPEAGALTDDALAYRLYLRGRNILYSSTRERPSHELAIRDFEAAVYRDTAFALAHAGLARGYQIRAKLGSDRGAQRQALEAAQRAVRLAPGDERTWATLGLVYREQGKYRDALGALRQAARRTPVHGDGSGLSNLGLVYLAVGQLDSALLWTDSAATLEPRSAPARMRVGMTWEALGHYANAERSYRLAARIDTASTEAQYRLARLWWMRGRAGQAHRQIERIRRTDPRSCFLFNWAALNDSLEQARELMPDDALDPDCEAPLRALVYASSGDEDQLDVESQAARQAFETGGEDFRTALVLAQLHALTRNPAGAFEMIDTAAARGYRNVLELRTLPTLQPLRSERVACERLNSQIVTMHNRVFSLRRKVPGAGEASASPSLDCS